MENGEIKNSLLFLDYIISNGFNPNDYYSILELFQSADGSMSQYLTDYTQYLLSKKVRYDELDSKMIEGAYGYLDEDGSILVPKTLESDDRFLHTPVLLPYKRHSYGTPSVDDFGVIIGHNPSRKDMQEHELVYSLINNSRINQYFGFCTDMNDTEEVKRKIVLYSDIVRQLNDSFGDTVYTFEHDTVKDKGKELCLIKRSK